MSGLPPRKKLKLINHDYCGRAVCSDHQLRQCDICGVDSTFGAVSHAEDEGEEVYSDEDEVDNQYEDDTNFVDVGRVYILEKGTNRFMPQWDDEVLGPVNTMGLKEDYNDSSPKALTPDQLHLHYCNACNLTWLQGYSDSRAAQSHPSHHTFRLLFAATSRSLVVFVDGKCPSNDSKAMHSSAGVYFGPNSPHNISKCLNGVSNQSEQGAEIIAAVEALRYVREVIEPARRAMIKDSLPWEPKNKTSDIRHFRLVIATDSSHVVERMCKHIENGTLIGEEVYRNADEMDVDVENSEGFVQLDHEVEELSVVGVQVAWYHIPREYNTEAKRLARMALCD